MKLNRKWVLVIALVLSVAAATAGTLAYLTDRDTEVNTFTMGSVDIEVEEDYEQDSPLLPGVDVEKKAGVKNNHETNEAWVWMTVSVPTDLVEYIDLEWLDGTPVESETVTGVHEGYTSYVVMHPTKLLPGTSTPKYLQGVKLSELVDFQGGEYGYVENGEFKPLPGDLTAATVIVDGFAVQPEGFATVEAAYEAYAKQWGEASAPTTDHWDGTSDPSWYNDTDTEFVLTTAEQLAGFAELVDGGKTFEGKTVKLGIDMCLGCDDDDCMDEPQHFNPIGHSSNGKSFNGTFDGQDNVIVNMYQQSDLGAWQYEGEYYGLFAYTNGATIKNLTVKDAYVSSGRNEAAAVVGNAENTKFENIAVEGTTLIGYNNSVGGVASECYGDCSFDGITVDEDTVIGPLWGTYDVRLGGVVGLVHAGNNVSFSDVNVACKIDAINDVAANYQYWLYRYSGMLIGNVDGVNGVADPTGYVTCENVTVTYGDWMNYHYCEDADLGAGSYNGPGEYKYGRVEAGTGTGGIDLSACNHNEDESHNVSIVFDQLFGGGQGVKGLKTYEGVTVNYPAGYPYEE